MRATRQPATARKSCSPRPRNSRPDATTPPSGTRISTSPRRCSRSRSCSGSVSIVAASRPLVHLSGILAIAGTLLMINGYFLLVHLPFE